MAVGNLLGHLLPGAAFAVLGAWHTLRTVQSYKHLLRTVSASSSSEFRSATWFPCPSPLPRRLELHLLLTFSALAVASQLLDLGHRHHHTLVALSLQPDSLQHATMYLHVAVYAAVALAADRRRPTSIGAGGDQFVAALAASVFGQELFLLRLHSTSDALEAHYHALLQLAVAASAVSASFSAVAPRSFVVAVVRSASVLFQGLWFVVMGCALWVPALAPAGCRRGAVCETEDAARRAVMMADLQFSWVLAAVWVFMAYLCLRAVDHSRRCPDDEYTQLQVFAGDDDDADATTTTPKRAFPVEEQVYL